VYGTHSVQQDHGQGCDPGSRGRKPGSRPGRGRRFARRSSFILHVSARDAGAAQIAVTPTLSTVEDAPPGRTDEPELLHRAPANAATGSAAAAHRLTSDEAREQLAHLATALQGPQAPFHGCMSPVRVRLVRADGGIFERQGCRSELGWSRAVSEAVSSFVSASLHGAAGGPTRLPQPQAQPPASRGAAPTSVQNQGSPDSRGV
jgi:hypothetical protein